MDETCCPPYNTGSTVPMETFLFHEEYEMYNADHALDNLIYFQLFECDHL